MSINTMKLQGGQPHGQRLSAYPNLAAGQTFYNYKDPMSVVLITWSASSSSPWNLAGVFLFTGVSMDIKDIKDDYLPCNYDLLRCLGPKP